MLLFPMVFLSSWACGQAPQQQTSPAPSLNPIAEEVSIDLVAHDRKNRPILDLKPGEIAVLDNDSPVAITGLRLVASRSGSDRLISMVFDQMEPSLVKDARKAAAKILKAIPERGFSVAVLNNIDGRLRVKQGYSSDRNDIERAITAATEAVEPGQGGALSLAEQQLIAESRTGMDASGRRVSVEARASAQALVKAQEDSMRIVQEDHAQPSLASLLALSRSQQQIPERKALVYFTQHREVDSRTKETFTSIIGAANRAGVSIYIIELNGVGLNARRQISFFDTGRTSIDPRQQQLQSDLMSAVVATYDHKGPESPMENLAKSTGGIYIAGEDGLSDSLGEMIQDLTTYYEATYLPSIKEYDGLFHEIAIKPLRKGLKVRSQGGYYALRTGSGTGTRPFELPLLKILSEAQLPTDLTFRAAILRMGDLPDGNLNTLAIEAPLSDLEIHEDTSTNLYTAHLSIVAQIKDKTGNVIERFSEDIPRRGALEEVKRARLDNFLMQRNFNAPPDDYLLEAAILDRNSGMASAQRIPFTIPKLAGGPSVSDMVFVRKTEPFHAETDPMEPLRHANDKVTPNLSAQVPPEARDVSVFFILHPDAHATSAATLNMQVLRDGKQIGSAPMASRQVNGPAATSMLVTFPANSLPHGFYQVKAIVSQGGKTAESSISFTQLGVQPSELETEAEDASLPLPKIDDRPTGQLAINFPPTPSPRPAESDLRSILADATERALAYRASLPNFICIEVTNRKVDSNGMGEWMHKDTIAELLTYQDDLETRKTLELDGKKSDEDRDDLFGMLSIGEFGGVLQTVFQPSSKASFQWEKTGILKDDTVQVFDYQVARKNSTFYIKVSALGMYAIDFHGQLFIDSAIRSVRRITLVADNVPQKLKVRAPSFSVDYDYVVINNHDYLMPIGAKVAIGQNHRNASLNEIEFRNYRRFGSTVKIVPSGAEGKPSEALPSTLSRGQHIQ